MKETTISIWLLLFLFAANPTIGQQTKIDVAIAIKSRIAVLLTVPSIVITSVDVADTGPNLSKVLEFSAGFELCIHVSYL